MLSQMHGITSIAIETVLEETTMEGEDDGRNDYKKIGSLIGVWIPK
jgi:hypothetical protein